MWTYEIVLPIQPDSFDSFCKIKMEDICYRLQNTPLFCTNTILAVAYHGMADVEMRTTFYWNITFLTSGNDSYYTVTFFKRNLASPSMKVRTAFLYPSTSKVEDLTLNDVTF